VNALDKAEFFGLVRRGASDIHLIGWACDTGDAGEILRNVFQTAPPSGSENTSGVSDPELDRLIAAVDSTPEEEHRGDALRDALARVAVLRPTIPLIVPHEIVAHSARVSWDKPPNSALLLETFHPAP
jgi:ABC-type oligopeptide transport system substrate-binding subunit